MTEPDQVTKLDAAAHAPWEGAVARPILALTLGDPAGIGPEIALKAAAALARRPEAPALAILGDRATLAETARALDLPLPPHRRGGGPVPPAGRGDPADGGARRAIPPRRAFGRSR
jgi:hypothetical protein